MVRNFEVRGYTGPVSQIKTEPRTTDTNESGSRILERQSQPARATGGWRARRENRGPDVNPGRLRLRTFHEPRTSLVNNLGEKVRLQLAHADLTIRRHPKTFSAIVTAVLALLTFLGIVRGVTSGSPLPGDAALMLAFAGLGCVLSTWVFPFLIHARPKR